MPENSGEASLYMLRSLDRQPRFQFHVYETLQVDQRDFAQLHVANARNNLAVHEPAVMRTARLLQVRYNVRLEMIFDEAPDRC